MNQYILAIDQGTTSSRALLFDCSGAHIATAQREFKQFFPHDGWVEHDPDEIWQSTLAMCQQVLDQVPDARERLVSVGITNQRETTIVWERASGKAIYSAIVWQDRRTSAVCEQLKVAGHEAEVSTKTGLLIDPYFSATKIAWILDKVEGARERAERGELAFGTVDSYLLWQLTKGEVHATDATNASRTSLFDIHKQDWDEALLSLFKVPRALLPEVKDSSDDFGRVASEHFGVEVPVNALIGDQQAALVGQACFEPGMIKSTYGTGCFAILNTGSEVLSSKNRLLSTVAYRINGEVSYALEGSIFVAGAAVQWLRDGLKFIAHASETEGLASSVGYNNSVYLVPAFTGLGAPYWDPDARGALFGLSRDTSIAEIVTAGLQSVCYQTRDLLNAMAKDGAQLSSLRVDGGMVVNDWVAQFLADALQLRVDRPETVETTALGAAYLAGLQAGVFDSLAAIAEKWRLERSFKADISAGAADQLYDGWLDAVERVRSH